MKDVEDYDENMAIIVSVSFIKMKTNIYFNIYTLHYELSFFVSLSLYNNSALIHLMYSLNKMNIN